MPKIGPSYKDLYELVDQRTSSIQSAFESFKKEEFSPLREKVERMWIYTTLAAGIIVLVFEVGIKEVFRVFAK